MPSRVVAKRGDFLAALDHLLLRDRDAVAVVRLDLDRFARIRQVFGAEVAARIRATILARIEALVGDTSAVMSYAEDAFVCSVRVESTSIDALEEIGMRFVESVSAPIQIPGQPDIAVGSNAGIAAAAHFDGVEPLQLIAGAELAIQRADAIGSRRVIVYEVASGSDPTRIPQLYADMWGAIGRREFTAYFQPVMLLPSLRVIGAEALIRWEHPQHGVLLPRDFIPEAERSGLIRDIDSLVWERAWSFFAELPESEKLTLSVNLSPADLDFPGLVEKVERFVDTTGLSPKRLVFEATETALAQDWTHARRRLEGLKELGAWIAIDDFGSGHMFLDRLATGLFDILKIDRSLVAPAEDPNGRAQHLLAGVVSLAQNLGLMTLAEGVETEEQLRRVLDAGCTYAQGYRFARPMPGAEFAALIAQR